MRAILQQMATKMKDRIVQITNVPVTRTQCTIYLKDIESDTTSDGNQTKSLSKKQRIFEEQNIEPELSSEV